MASDPDASKRHVHFSSSASPAARSAQDASAAQEDREREEAVMLMRFSDVLAEDFPLADLESWLLYRATEDPACVAGWLLTETSGERRVEGIVRYLRDQMFPIVEEECFESWVQLLKARREEDVFWSLVVAMTLDESVEALVTGTWKGSKRSLECVMEYYRVRLSELLESPFDEKNANDILVSMWALIRSEVLPMNMRKIVLNGVLKPVIVPLSRNAHRKRRQEMRQAEHDDSQQASGSGGGGAMMIADGLS